MSPEQSAAVQRMRDGMADIADTELVLAALDEAQQDAARLQWLLSCAGDWAICEWSEDADGLGYYRDSRDPSTVRAAIDAAHAGDAA